MLFLQLENSLADAREALEKAGEALHDAAVQAAQRKSEYDLKQDMVQRLEGALRALHGEAPSAQVTTVTPKAERKPRPKPEGPACNGCGEQGTLVRQGPLVVCTACQAQSVA